MFRLLGIILLVFFFGNLAKEYALMNKNDLDSEIKYRFRPVTDITNLGSESFLRTHFDMFQKNSILSSKEYTQGLLDKIDLNLTAPENYETSLDTAQF